MADKYDPYREALVMETSTVWPEDYDAWEPEERRRVEAQLHADAQHASHLEYERTHTGFCRVITVTEADIARLK